MRQSNCGSIIAFRFLKQTSLEKLGDKVSGEALIYLSFKEIATY